MLPVPPPLPAAGFEAGVCGVGGCGVVVLTPVAPPVFTVPGVPDPDPEPPEGGAEGV